MLAKLTQSVRGWDWIPAGQVGVQVNIFSPACAVKVAEFASGAHCGRGASTEHSPLSTRERVWERGQESQEVLPQGVVAPSGSRNRGHTR